MRLPLAALVLLLLGAGCLGPSTPETEEPSTPTSALDAPTAATPRSVIAVGGSSSAMPAFDLAVETFAASRPDIDVRVVRGLGSSGGMKALHADEIDLVALARPPKEAERTPDLASALYYRDAIALFAHPSLGITTITADELAGIYQGAFSNGDEVGGNRVPIRLVSRDKDDSEMERVMEIWPALDAEWRSDLILVHSDDEKIAAIASTPGAIAFADRVPVGLSGADVVHVTIEGAEAHASDLALEFHLAWREPLPDDVAAFRDHLLAADQVATLDAAKELR